MHYRFLAAATMVLLAGMALSGQASRPLVPLVRQVDHILIDSGDPKALFSFFVDTLQLPAARLLSESTGYTNGAIGLGNLNIELFRYSEKERAPQIKARYSGLAFQPLPLDRALAELESRGFAYARPEPYVSDLPDRSRGVAWTTVALPPLSRPRMSIFLYEYSPKFLQVEVRRKQMANRLMLNNGGPLGVLSAADIAISTTNIKKESLSWSLLLGTPTRSQNWTVGTGPSIRLVPGAEGRILEITLKVKSLNSAKAFLEKKRLLGSVSANRVSISPSGVQGLRISLRE